MIERGNRFSFYILAASNAAPPATKRAAVGSEASRASFSETVAGTNVAVGVMESANGGVGTEAALPKAATCVEMDGFGVADWFPGFRTLRRMPPCG